MSLSDLYRTKKPSDKDKKPRKPAPSHEETDLGSIQISEDTAKFWTAQGCGKPC